MERVQWNQEAMLSELKDLQDKRIFSAQEVRQIFKQRTAFEMALIRKAPAKRDFLAYAEYEMNLERLRRMRVKKMSEPCLNRIGSLILTADLRNCEESLAFGSLDRAAAVPDL